MEHDDQQEALRNLIAYKQLQELQKMNGSQPQNNSSDPHLDIFAGLCIMFLVAVFIILLILDCFGCLEAYKSMD